MKERSANGSLSGTTLHRRKLADFGKQAELNAIAQGIDVPPDAPVEGRSVDAAIAAFIEETRITKKPKTLAAYTTALTYFRESLSHSKAYLEDIERLNHAEIHGIPSRRKETVSP